MIEWEKLTTDQPYKITSTDLVLLLLFFSNRSIYSSEKVNS